MSPLRMSVAVEGLIRRYPAQWRLWNTMLPRWEEAAKLAEALNEMPETGGRT